VSTFGKSNLSKEIQFLWVSRKPDDIIIVPLNGVHFTGSDFYFKFGFAGRENMENKDVLELHKILRRHEDFIQSNRSALFSVTSKRMSTFAFLNMQIL